MLHTAGLNVGALLDACFATHVDADWEWMRRPTDSSAKTPSSATSPLSLSPATTSAMVDREAALELCIRFQEGLRPVVEYTVAVYQRSQDESATASPSTALSLTTASTHSHVSHSPLCRVVQCDEESIEVMKLRLIQHCDKWSREASLINAWQELIERFLDTGALASPSPFTFTYSLEIPLQVLCELPLPAQQHVSSALSILAAQLGVVDLKAVSTTDLSQVEALFRRLQQHDGQLLSTLHAACETRLVECERELDDLDSGDNPFTDGERSAWEPLHAQLVKMDRVKDDVEQLKELLEADVDFLASWETLSGRPGRISVQYLPSVALLMAVREEMMRKGI